MKFRQSLFWDVNPKKIDTEKNARYIIERILDFGNDKEVRWLYHFYDRVIIKDVLKKSKSIRPRTRSLWQLMLKS